MFSSPLLLGFDQFERTLDRISKSAGEGYPPYNIEQLGDDGLRITVAVAGFTSDDLNIQVEDNQLIVRGRQDDDKSRVYLHRGIAARQFQRSFILADGIEVVDASLDNGLLNIDLRRPMPEPKIKQIQIKCRNSKQTDRTALEPSSVMPAGGVERTVNSATDGGINSAELNGGRTHE